MGTNFLGGRGGVWRRGVRGMGRVPTSWGATGRGGAGE